MPSEPTVLIHGDTWKLADVTDQIAACRIHTWRREHWRRRPALVHRVGGTTSLYHGQTFDPGNNAAHFGKVCKTLGAVEQKLTKRDCALR